MVNAYLRNAENGIALSIDGIFAVQFNRSMFIVCQGPTFANPFDLWRRFTAEPEVIANRPAFLECDVVHAVTDEMRGNCKEKIFMICLISVVSTVLTESCLGNHWQ